MLHVSSLGLFAKTILSDTLLLTLLDFAPFFFYSNPGLFFQFGSAPI